MKNKIWIISEKNKFYSKKQENNESKIKNIIKKIIFYLKIIGK